MLTVQKFPFDCGLVGSGKTYTTGTIIKLELNNKSKFALNLKNEIFKSITLLAAG